MQFQENGIETKVTSKSTPSVNPKNGNSLFKLQIFDIFEDKFNTSYHGSRKKKKLIMKQ
jgi:hypothetical protein